jgi:hypothetical protein
MIRNIFSFFLSVVLSHADQFDVNSALKEIASAPDWTAMDEKHIITDGSKIINTFSKYCDLPSENARLLIQRLAESGDEFNLSIASKIYIFNRMYFNVPEMTDRVGWKFFGGWSGIPINETNVRSLFPLAIKDDGSTELKNVFSGYSGASYRGLDEFDFFLERFGPRKDRVKR